MSEKLMSKFERCINDELRLIRIKIINRCEFYMDFDVNLRSPKFSYKNLKFLFKKVTKTSLTREYFSSMCKTNRKQFMRHSTITNLIAKKRV